MPNNSPNKKNRQLAGLPTLKAVTVLAAGIGLLPAFALAAPDLSGLLGTLNAAPEGSWTKVNLNSFSDAWLPEDHRVLHPSSYTITSTVISSWSSFAWDSNRGDLILFGGGHASYAGNEIYRWSGVTQQWSRASLPSQVTQFSQDIFFPVDGAMNAPQSSHTYDNSLYLPVVDRFMTFGGAAFQTGGPFLKQTGPSTVATTGPYFWDPAKADPNKVGGTTGSGVDPATLGGQMWNNRDAFTVSNLANLSVKPATFIEGTTGYRTENGKDVVYVTGTIGAGVQQALWKITINDVNNPANDHWELVGVPWNAFAELGAAAVDPINNLYVRTGISGSNQALAVFDLNQPGGRDVPITFSYNGSGPNLLEGAGMDYDPVRDRFLFWSGGESVWSLDVPDRLADGSVQTSDWVMVKDSDVLGVAPPDFIVNAVNGKWKYVAGLDAFMALEGPSAGNVWLYKPTDWVNPQAVPLPGSLLFLLSGIAMINRKSVGDTIKRAYSSIHG